MLLRKRGGGEVGLDISYILADVLLITRGSYVKHV